LKKTYSDKKSKKLSLGVAAIQADIGKARTLPDILSDDFGEFVDDFGDAGVFLRGHSGELGDLLEAAGVTSVLQDEAMGVQIGGIGDHRLSVVGAVVPTSPIADGRPGGNAGGWRIGIVEPLDEGLRSDAPGRGDAKEVGFEANEQVSHRIRADDVAIVAGVGIGVALLDEIEASDDPHLMDPGARGVEEELEHALGGESRVDEDLLDELRSAFVHSAKNCVLQARLHLLNLSRDGDAVPFGSDGGGRDFVDAKGVRATKDQARARRFEASRNDEEGGEIGKGGGERAIVEGLHFPEEGGESVSGSRGEDHLRVAKGVDQLVAESNAERAFDRGCRVDAAFRLHGAILSAVGGIGPEADGEAEGGEDDDIGRRERADAENGDNLASIGHLLSERGVREDDAAGVGRIIWTRGGSAHRRGLLDIAEDLLGHRPVRGGATIGLAFLNPDQVSNVADGFFVGIHSNRGVS
jgi:hypothetical protein